MYYFSKSLFIIVILRRVHDQQHNIAMALTNGFDKPFRPLLNIYPLGFIQIEIGLNKYIIIHSPLELHFSFIQSIWKIVCLHNYTDLSQKMCALQFCQPCLSMYLFRSYIHFLFLCTILCEYIIVLLIVKTFEKLNIQAFVKSFLVGTKDTLYHFTIHFIFPYYLWHLCKSSSLKKNNTKILFLQNKMKIIT